MMEINFVKNALLSANQALASTLSLLMGGEVRILPGEPEHLALADFLKKHQEPCLATEIGFPQGLLASQVLVLCQQKDERAVLECTRGDGFCEPSREGENESGHLLRLIFSLLGGAFLRELLPFSFKSRVPSSVRMHLNHLFFFAGMDANSLLWMPCRYAVGDRPAFEMKYIVTMEATKALMGMREERDVSAPDKARKVHFPAWEKEDVQEGEADWDLIKDVPVPVGAYLGKVKLPIKELAGLKSGSILPIGPAEDSPVDIMIQGQAVARGEVVVVGEHYGVLIREILR